MMFNLEVGAKSRKSGKESLEQFVQDHSVYLEGVDMQLSDRELTLFDSAAKKSKVFALGESEHGVYEPAKLRNRIFKYLVEKHDYRVMMLESGLLESRLVDLYIKGEKVPGFVPSDSSLSQQEIEAERIKYVLYNGVTHKMGEYEETKELVLWMKNYNQRVSKNEQLSFVGPDLTVIGDSPFFAFTEFSKFLKAHDPVWLTSKKYQDLLAIAKKISEPSMLVRKLMKARYGDSIEIDPDLLDAFGTVGFDQITKSEEVALDLGIKEITNKFLKKKTIYQANGVSQTDLDWFELMPVFASHMVRNLKSRRKYPKVYLIEKVHSILKQAGIYDQLIIKDYKMDMTNPDDIKTNIKGRETREQSLAELIMKTESLKGKTMIFAHNLHLIKGPTKITLGNINVGISGALGEGQFLKKHYQDQYHVIVTSMGEYVEPIDVTPINECNNCIEAEVVKLANLDDPIFLDLEKANQVEKRYLRKFLQHRNQFDFQEFQPLESYDQFIYFNTMKHGNKLKD